MTLFQDVVDTIAFSVFGGVSFYYISYTFEFKENKYDLMVKLGIILGCSVGIMKAYY